MNMNQEISRMVTRFHAIHRSVLLLYISRFCNISMDMANNTLHHALAAHYCYEMGDYICESDLVKTDSYAKQMSRAIRVAMEFMALEEYTFFERRVLTASDCTALLYVLLPPSEEAMKKNAAAATQLLQISYIPRGSEIATSRMLASVPISKEVRNVTRRVAIVETGFRQEYIAKAGYMMFIRFGKDKFTFNSDDVFYTDKETRWDDVAEKTR